MRSSRLLGWLLLALGAVVASLAVVGPLMLGVIHYRTSHTTLNQIAGGDVAALALVAPVCVVAGVYALRGHRAAVAALAPSAFVLYTYAQLVIGQEYLRLPGNNERFFPLFLLGFVIAGTVFALSWNTGPLPAPGPPVRRITIVALWTVAAFLLLQHLPSLADAWRAIPTRTEYVSSPTPFWLVKLMDLGIVVPAAIATAVGLRRNAAWAIRATYAIVGAYALLGASVAAMAIVMYARHDPDASLLLVAGFSVLAAVFWTLAVLVYRPLLRPGRTSRLPRGQRIAAGGPSASVPPRRRGAG